MNLSVKKIISFFIFTTLFSVFAVAQTRYSSQPHSGSVTTMKSSSDGFFSAGQDGFIIKWNENGEGEHFQISDLEIRDFAVHPNGNLIAVYETDGYSINRLSLWDWKTKTRKFSKRSSNPITTLAFSEKGTFLLVGTNAVDGLMFINTTSGSSIKKMRDIPSMVTLAGTSATENSGVSYSQLGYLVYANLKNQETKIELSVEANLSQPVLFCNDLIFAGYKDGYIWMYHAYSAKLLTKIKAANPTLVTQRSDSDLMYIEQDGRNYALKMIDVNIDSEANSISVPTYSVIVKNFYTESRQAITTATANATTIFAGCENGTIHTISKEPDTALSSSVCISQNNYDKILDVEENGSTFYILSEKNLLRTSYSGKENQVLIPNPGYTNILKIDEDTLLFWSKEQKKTIAMAKESEGWVLKNLYTPSGNIMNIHYENDNLVLIEGSSRVSLYSFETGKSKTLYTGTGVQDALLYDENTLYVAKSASSSPKSALIEVNVTTQETLELAVSAEVSYSLTSSNTGGAKAFYGISVFSTPAKKTEIFTYSPSQKKYTTIVTFQEEDTQAFVLYSNGRLFTNISQDKIRSVTISSKKQTVYNRYKALPAKLTVNDTHVLVLNKDGSISWFSATSSTQYGNWYLSIDGEWIAFD